MDIHDIQDALAPTLAERGLFLVEIHVSKDNDITVTVESATSVVTLDDCEVLNRVFTDTFDQDKEDYSLTVTSAGLDATFKVDAQFEKARGKRVEVWFKGGKKLTGTMEGFSDSAITIDGTVYARKEINKVKYHIEF